MRLELVSQSNRDANWRSGLSKVGGDGGIIIELDTGEGLSGLGYVTEAPYTGEVVGGIRHVLEKLFQSVLVGSDPFTLPSLMAQLDLAVYGYQRTKAAVEVAILDLIAKAGSVPLYALFGGLYRESIPVIRIVSIKPPAEMAASAEQLVSEGYRHLKLKVAHDGRDVERVAEIRRAVGPEVALTLDPSEGWTPKQAIETLRRMQEFDIALVEQPVRRDDDAGMRVVRDAVRPIVEGDETADTLAGVYRVARSGSVDGVALKTSKLGGPSNVMRAAAICRAANLHCRIGKSGESRLSSLVDMHLIAAIPNIDFACEVGEFARMTSDPTDGIEIVDGTLAVTHVPGHGAFLR